MNYIEQLKKFDSAEISDVLDSIGIEGALLDIRPIADNLKIVGPAFTVKYDAYENKNQNEFKNAGNYIDDVPVESVVIIDNDGRSDCTTWGDILTQVAMKNNIAGTIVNGAIRDVEYIRGVKYPLYAKSIYMRSGKNRVYKSDHQCKLCINGVSIKPNDIIFADDNGVIVIPLQYAETVISRAENIRVTENNIIESIRAGMRLDDARKKHRYDQPWLNSSEKA